MIEKATQPGKDERINGFSALNLAGSTAAAALVQTEVGERAKADALLATADRYLAQAKAQGAGGANFAFITLLVEQWRARIALLDAGSGPLSQTQTAQTQAALAKLNEARAGSMKFDQGKTLLRAVHEGYADAYTLSARLALRVGDAAASAEHALQAVAQGQKMAHQTPRKGLTLASAQAALAKALAAQGQWQPARQALAPALAAYQAPAVQHSDDQLIKFEHAQVLLAAAQAHADQPAEKAKFLALATRQLGSMPASLKRVKSAVLLRQEIAAEMAKR